VLLAEHIMFLPQYSAELQFPLKPAPQRLKMLASNPSTHAQRMTSVPVQVMRSPHCEELLQPVPTLLPDLHKKQNYLNNFFK
jgi:hypothetical protein